MKPLSHQSLAIASPHAELGLAFMAHSLLQTEVAYRLVGVGPEVFDEDHPVLPGAATDHRIVVEDAEDALRTTAFVHELLNRIRVAATGNDTSVVTFLRIITAGTHVYFEAVVDGAILLVAVSDSGTCRTNLQYVFAALAMIYRISVPMVTFDDAFDAQAQTTIADALGVPASILPCTAEEHPAWGVFDSHQR